jgi:hypothetical protein
MKACTKEKLKATMLVYQVVELPGKEWLNRARHAASDCERILKIQVIRRAELAWNKHGSDDARLALRR